jgi:hypothetical protein
MNIEMNSQSDTPSNGIYIILGEINLLLTNLRRYHKYGGSSGSGGGGSHYVFKIIIFKKLKNFSNK